VTGLVLHRKSSCGAAFGWLNATVPARWSRTFFTVLPSTSVAAPLAISTPTLLSKSRNGLSRSPGPPKTFGVEYDKVVPGSTLVPTLAGPTQVAQSQRLEIPALN
jgi:hypothetical protein